MTLSRGFLILLLVLAGCSMILPQAEAAGPIVTTLPATNVTATSALLRGSINPVGFATQWDFVSTSIYCPRPPGNLPANNSTHPVSCTASGLTPSTVYQFAVRATNALGTSVGSLLSFTTAAAMATTDWELSSPTLSPASPNVGDAVTFNVVLRVMSTNQPYPQSFTIAAQLDGVTIAGGSRSYPGPTGSTMNVYSTPPWTATAGSHTIVWQVSGAVSDPNTANNVVTRTFTVGPAPAQFDFGLSVSPTERTAAPGSSASYAVTVNLVAGSSQLVTLSLSGEPGGVTGAFSPSSGSPSFSSSLTLAVDSSTSPGSYSMTITGTGGGRTHTVTITLVVSEAKDFRVEATPASRTVNQGEIVSYSVNVVGLHGFNSQVSLSVSGLPSGGSYLFSTPSATPDFSSTLTVTLPDNVETGSFTLTIKGSGGGLDRIASALLVIGATTQTQTQTETTTGFYELIQQNSLLLSVLLLVIGLVVAALLMRGRKPSYPPPPPEPAKACPTCGKPLSYIREYDRWYCYSCKEYK